MSKEFNSRAYLASLVRRDVCPYCESKLLWNYLRWDKTRWVTIWTCGTHRWTYDEQTIMEAISYDIKRLA